MFVFKVYSDIAISVFFNFLKYLIIKSIDPFINTRDNFNNIKFLPRYLITIFSIVEKLLIVKKL